MTDAALIGSWVTRVRYLVPLTRAHKVESLVADEPITRCGRRLRVREGTAFAYSFEEPSDGCKTCGGRA